MKNDQEQRVPFFKKEVSNSKFQTANFKFQVSNVKEEKKIFFKGLHKSTKVFLSKKGNSNNSNQETRKEDHTSQNNETTKHS